MVLDQAHVPSNPTIAAPTPRGPGDRPELAGHPPGRGPRSTPRGSSGGGRRRGGTGAAPATFDGPHRLPNPVNSTSTSDRPAERRRRRPAARENHQPSQPGRTEEATAPGSSAGRQPSRAGRSPDRSSGTRKKSSRYRAESAVRNDPSTRRGARGSARAGRARSGSPRPSAVNGRRELRVPIPAAPCHRGGRAAPGSRGRGSPP